MRTVAQELELAIARHHATLSPEERRLVQLAMEFGYHAGALITSREHLRLRNPQYIRHDDREIRRTERTYNHLSQLLE